MRGFAVALDHVSFAFPGHERPLLSDLCLEVPEGELIAILGPSGVGKSTLLNLVAGLLKPTHGSVWVAGAQVSQQEEGQATAWRGRHIGFVFQQFHLLPHLTVAENVAIPLAINEGRWRPSRVETLLTALGLAHRASAYPRALSGGEAQRVAIARALIHRPAVLLADEPTGNLDPETAEQVLDLFSEALAIHRTTALLVTHSEAAAARARRVYRLTRHHLNGCQISAADTR